MCVITVFFIYKYTFDRKEIIINVNDKTEYIVTYENFVKDVLKNEKILLYEGDLVIPDKSTRVRDGMVINIKRAFPVFINLEKKRYQCKTTAATVEDILQLAGVKISSKDILNPKSNTIIDKTQIIEIIQVTEKELIETEEIPYKTKYIKDSNLEKGKSRLIQDGQNGLLEKNIIITFHNGKEVSREIVSKEIVREPVDKKVKIGTKTEITVNGENLNISDTMSLAATAYTHTGSKTYTGKTPQKGTAEVDPDIINLGNELYIKGYGFAIADDIGSTIKGARIDLFMETEEQALSWGCREVKAFILK
jgi:uncharacterized protein YabE (DUF348 family)